MVAAYPNAQVIYKDGTLNKEIVYWDVSEIRIKDNKIWVSSDKYKGFNCDASDFQLVLTSPSNITDAQALEVAKEYYPTVGMYQNSFYGKSLVEDYKSDFDMQASCTRELSDICRSLNMDFGYKNIPSLISAGLAVEKEVSHE